MNKILFLDRDGVINYDHGDYTWKKEQFSFLPGVIDACRIWHLAGYKIIVVTNQGGIAKGIYSHEDVLALHEYMSQEFSSAGVPITDIYYCPHHDNFGKCLCRKPGSVMIEKSLARFSADPAKCLMIGDRSRDVQAADSAGVRGILVETNSDLRTILQLIP